MRTPCLFALAACLVGGACAPLLGQTRAPASTGNGPGAMQLPPLIVFQDSAGPLAYRSTSIDRGALREVRGEACQSAVTLPIGLLFAAVEAGNTANAPAFLGAAWGQGGYAQAVASALSSTPGSRLVAVRADLNTRIVLGVWRQQCVRVVAAVVPAR